MKKIDFLLIGQGLAGTVLSYHLIKENKKILLLNHEAKISSSKVAAGIYNPITGQRLVKTWKADKIFPYLEHFYKGLENKLKVSFLHPMEVYRPFNSIEDQNECMGKTASGVLNGFISEISLTGKDSGIFNDPYGGITFNNCGYVDLAVMLKAYSLYLQTLGAYREEIFEEDKLIVNEDHIVYNNIIADKVIYCDGSESRESKFFNYLPFKIVKGDLIVVKADVSLNQIISKGIYIVPLQNGLYKAGATYNWNDSTNIPTPEGKIEIVEKLTSLLKSSFEVVEHYAGLRPATKDRRPFLGIHPLYKAVAIFNGLGSKGVSLAPYLAREFTNFLLHEKELEKDVNISRYNSLYFN